MCRFYSCQKTENLWVLLLPKKQKTCGFYSCQKTRKLVGFTFAKKQKTCRFYSCQNKQKTGGFYSPKRKPDNFGFYSSPPPPKNRKLFCFILAKDCNIGASCFFSVHSTSRSKKLINSESECFLKRSGLVFLLSY